MEREGGREREQEGGGTESQLNQMRGKINQIKPVDIPIYETVYRKNKPPLSRNTHIFALMTHIPEEFTPLLRNDLSTRIYHLN